MAEAHGLGQGEAVVQHDAAWVAEAHGLGQVGAGVQHDAAWVVAVVCDRRRPERPEGKAKRPAQEKWQDYA